MSQEATIEQLQAELLALRAENERLERKAKLQSSGLIKVSEKGAVSVYGLGKFPLTLYAGQWEKLLERSEDIKFFIVDNIAKLATKD